MASAALTHVSQSKEGDLMASGSCLPLLEAAPIDCFFATGDGDDDVPTCASIGTDSECASVDSERNTHGSVAASSASSSPAKATDSDGVRSKDAKRRSTYREKQKSQRDALRRQVTELSSELVVLQEARTAAQNRGGHEMATSGRLWKALASQRLQARLVAEEQQRRLHAAIVKRSALIESIGVVVRKRIAEAEPARGKDQGVGKRARRTSPNDALYETYLNEMDEVYARTEEVFRSSELHSAIDAGLRYKPSRVTYVASGHHELVGKVSTPFNFQRVCYAIGLFGCMENRQECRETYKGFDGSDGTIAVKFRVSSHRSDRSLLQYVVMRRYQERERLVAIWRKFTEGEGVFAGLHSDETGWNVVRPSPGCVDAGTVMESVIRFVPMNFNSATSSTALAGQFTDMVVSTGEEDCQECLRRMEQILLDEALGV
ncbi:hypothetical protein BBJ28_00003397 [Nothophytophthora sp. Chile5]|nr:hypothetical protein BBJ28_00003397 [Nothophytophthora sp. Chile5]